MKAEAPLEGDVIHVILCPDDEAIEIPDELMVCLKDEPKVLKFFESLSEGEQAHYIDWVYFAKDEEKRVERLAETINRLLKGRKLRCEMG